MNGTIHPTFLTCFLILCFAMSSAMAAEKPTCAVMNFDAKSGMAEKDAEFLSERFAGEFGKLGKFQLISQSKMKEVLDLQKFARTDHCSATECAIEAGRLLNAQWMVYGSIGKLENTWSVNVALVSVESGAISNQAIVDVEGKLDDLLKQGMRNAARELAGLPDLGGGSSKRVELPLGMGVALPDDLTKQPNQSENLTSKMKRLQIGMTKNQVKQLMGEPLKIDANQFWETWSYGPHSYKATIEFKKEKVSSWTSP